MYRENCRRRQPQRMQLRLMQFGRLPKLLATCSMSDAPLTPGLLHRPTLPAISALHPVPVSSPQARLAGPISHQARLSVRIATALLNLGLIRPGWSQVQEAALASSHRASLLDPRPNLLTLQVLVG